MKDSRYANRGSSFERFIKYANDRYRHTGEAFITKQCTEFIPLRDANGRVNNVKVEHQATFDFLGRYKQYPIAIEAKNTNTDSIRFDAVQPNQAEDMDEFISQNGTIGLVLVSFGLRKFYAIPWSFWSMAYDLRVRRRDKDTDVTIHVFGQSWHIPKKYSVRRDELNPAWEISTRLHGMDYLQDAEKYVTGADDTQK